MQNLPLPALFLGLLALAPGSLAAAAAPQAPHSGAAAERPEPARPEVP